MKGKLLFLVIALAFASHRAQAHHNFAASYFPDRTVTIEGRVVQFLFRNPHSFLHVETPDAKHQMETWIVEWGGGGQLSRAGVSKDTLRPGDHVIVTGNPSRNTADHKLHMVSIVRPADGWKWIGDTE